MEDMVILGKMGGEGVGILPEKERETSMMLRTRPQGPAPGWVRLRLGAYGPRKSQVWQSAGQEPSPSQADPRTWRPQGDTLTSSDPPRK